MKSVNTWLNVSVYYHTRIMQYTHAAMHALYCFCWVLLYNYVILYNCLLNERMYVSSGFETIIINMNFLMFAVFTIIMIIIQLKTFSQYLRFGDILTQTHREVSSGVHRWLPINRCLCLLKLFYNNKQKVTFWTVHIQL